jgi:hypothetical protein
VYVCLDAGVPGLRTLPLVGHDAQQPNTHIRSFTRPNRIRSSNPPRPQHYDCTLPHNHPTAALRGFTTTVSLWRSPRRLGTRRSSPTHPLCHHWLTTVPLRSTHLTLSALAPSSTTAPRLGSIMTVPPRRSPWRPGTRWSSHPPSALSVALPHLYHYVAA